MHTRGLKLEHPGVTRASAPLGLSVTGRMAWAERPLAILLSMQLALSIVLVALMAVRSPENAHPDEFRHFTAAEYFREHWLPPAVGAPGTESSYSEYGFSYLNEADFVYWAFGKASALGGVGGMGAMRSLQVLLYFGLIAWMVYRARQFTPGLGFLLLTPQVWYVFSYVNGDALPFALLTVLLVEFGWPHSSVRRFLKGTQAAPTPGVFVVGALLGLLAMSKRNYLVSFVFLGFVILWLRHEVRHWSRIVLLASTAAVIALPWLTYHAWVNDWQTGKRVAEYSEQVASPALKPSAQASPSSFRFRALRTKGASLWDVVVTLHWGEISFRSFCGLYGWMNIEADPWTYRIFAVLYAALLAILVTPSLRRGPPGARPLLVGVLICAGLVIAQSVYWSWVYDFQAQGRYLFPILPMLFFYWRQYETATRPVPALVVSAVLGANGLLSFALIGLPVLGWA